MTQIDPKSLQIDSLCSPTHNNPTYLTHFFTKGNAGRENEVVNVRRNSSPGGVGKEDSQPSSVEQLAQQRQLRGSQGLEVLTHTEQLFQTPRLRLSPRRPWDNQRRHSVDVLTGSDRVTRALEAHRDYIMSETLATEWTTGQADALFSIERELGDERWSVEFKKA